MVKRLHNLSKWRELKAGDGIEFVGERDRRVRIEFNTETATRLHLVHGDDDDTQVTFVTVVEGFDVVEFTAPGNCVLAATSDGEVWYFTNEGDVEATDRQAVSFTKVMNRRARNPELERMMWKMEQNIAARMSVMEAELEARYAATGQRYDPDTGEVEDDDEIGVGDTGGDTEPPADEGDSSAAI